MRIEDWGLIEYEQAQRLQLEKLEEVARGDSDDILVLCTHPPVVTLGRGSSPEDMIGWAGPTIEVSRGGRATYHGPNQVVIYPIIDLRKETRGHLRTRDVNAYLRALESAVVKGLEALGVRAEARTVPMKNADGSELSVTGVWVGARKIASIGIAVRKWITYHGVALNVTADPQAFRGIRPCGFNASVMTSLEESAGPVNLETVKAALTKSFLEELR